MFWKSHHFSDTVHPVSMLGLRAVHIYPESDPRRELSLRDVSVGHCAEIDLIDTSSHGRKSPPAVFSMGDAFGVFSNISLKQRFTRSGGWRDHGKWSRERRCDLEI